MYNEEFFYITVLSNFMFGFDKYKKVYSKSNLTKSTFPNEFYLLKEDELSIGINKALKLQKKLNIGNNYLIKISTRPSISNQKVFKNTKTGLGWFIESSEILINDVFICYTNNEDIHNYFDMSWEKISVENLFALSLKHYLSIDGNGSIFTQLKPKTFSFLPVAMACQAKCKFCFSHSSISKENIKKFKDFNFLEDWMQYSSLNGAERFVITGGGDPGLFGLDNLLNTIRLSKKYFRKTILFTNGIFLEKEKNKDEILDDLIQLKNAGLDTLSLSVHHYDSKLNTEIMGINTQVDRILDTLSGVSSDKIPSIRLICVLQKEGINNSLEISKFVDYALSKNVPEICFKELYVSSGIESIYSTQASNIYSANNQISLNIVLDYMKNVSADLVAKLPWGSPIFSVNHGNRTVKIAVYTEPSVGWELANGIARSWNYLSNNKCYASLEDLNSEIKLNMDMRVL